MGYGSYSAKAHRALTKKRAAKSLGEVFQRNDCDPAMNPRGVRARESRDSEAHPESLGIVFALDVSGSMEAIPKELATETLPTFMEHAMAVVPSPQILPMAFGNAYADHSPLQVGQFESSAELIDRWLSAIHVESGGGGLGESYGLAMYFCAHHTSMDCFEKRKKRGYFFMTGDEVPFTHVVREQVAGLIGTDPERDIPVREVVLQLQKTFHVFFLIPSAERAAIEMCGVVWELLLRERCVVLQSTADAAIVCALLIGIEERLLKSREDLEAHLVAQGTGAADRARLLATVAPFMRARAKGKIKPPGHPGTRTDSPDVRG